MPRLKPPAEKPALARMMLLVGSMKLRFVVHEHRSSHHHFDLRLSAGGVLRSWAIPKGPSMNPAERRLAIAVADHPLAYADFEGIIPKGTYGAGPVAIWDEGYYTTTDGCDPLVGLEQGHLSFELHGTKLNGRFSLRVYPGRENQWLLIKARDEFADPRWVTESVLTPALVGRLRVRIPPCEVA